MITASKIEAMPSREVNEESLIRSLNDLSVRANTLREQLNGLLPSENLEMALETIDDIRLALAQSEQFIREEVFVTLGERTARDRAWNIHTLPKGFEVEFDQDRIYIRAPFWAMGPARNGKFKVSFHNHRPFVREHVFWDSLASMLVREGALTLSDDPETAEVTFTFFTCGSDQAHLTNPNLEEVIGALAANHLVPIDAPNRTNIHLQWVNVEHMRDEHIDIEILR